MTQVKDLVDAYDAFITGCKADGTWSAIKASCIMAGWDNLDGALVPLAGTAPTNTNFVAGDYNRVTGLKGDRSSKYLDTNSSPNAAPETNTSFAYAVYCTALPTASVDCAYIGYRGNTASELYQLHRDQFNLNSVYNKYGSPITATQSTGFIGSSRNNTAQVLRSGGSNTTATSSSTGTFTNQTNVGVFSFREVSGSRANLSDARLSFYMQGGFLDLTLLDSRVTTLMSDIAAAIP